MDSNETSIEEDTSSETEDDSGISEEMETTHNEKDELIEKSSLNW